METNPRDPGLTTLTLAGLRPERVVPTSEWLGSARIERALAAVGVITPHHLQGVRTMQVKNKQRRRSKYDPTIS